ncbi:SWI/SNF-related matrix-associated actin-dependent regulator of chromatin subfamily A containing DEAD/H box 1A [Megalops cyprinoides]|uniref:SWI/SNF-related matrix-associated actin-dependent regulator of chromatin subfamily A containing DEAD/H box 1A n=1 Tax=Megalops cyprinoides TaxID=118141 RepID=UPI00186453E9|nr:SWI/SNF-related matrix-associated actin-dependent regulator of chromatin subfamily A containing DEAD/H box 1A [Megalops cyprinoides]
MSLFNLDRFRYGGEKTHNKIKNNTSTSIQDEHSSGSASPDSEKENKPIPEIPVHKRPCGKKQERGVQFEDSDSESEDDAVAGGCIREGLVRRGKMPGQVLEKRCEVEDECEQSSGPDKEDKSTEEKLSKLQEIFPRRDRKELLEVIKSTSTLDGAVASCLVVFGDEGPDTSRKRKQNGSNSSSQDSDEVQPSKKRRASVASDSDEDGAEPTWEKQEAMVRRLQRKFPNLDKEELRAVLQEHDWDFDDALEVLRVFSDQDEDSTSPEDKGKRPKAAKSSRDASPPKVTKQPSARKDKRDSGEGSAHSGRSSGISGWLSTARPRPSSPAPRKPQGGVSAAKAQAAERKKQARAAAAVSAQPDGSSEDEDAVSSEFEGSSADSDSDSEDGVSPEMRARILGFFQEASVDELSLIGGCSVKKAQKIAELRPYNTWQDLKETFHKGNGLSMELVWGCRVVLKEREVVLGLMGKCETISRKMTKDVTRVVERGVGSMKPPAVLNSRLQLKPYQLIGLNWLVLLHQNKLSGILADEMGLGKTIQAISFLAKLFEEGDNGPHLIIVPSSTLDNWVRELKLWCPSLEVLVYYGSAEDRKYLRHDILNKQVEFNIIVSTYNMAIGNESDRSLFRKLKMQCAVFDEGHMLKNMNSLRYRHLMAINAQYRLLLTGTPLQNNLLELMSLLNFIMPTMFSSSTSQIAKMFSMKSSEEQSSFEKDRIAHAKRIMKPFILRRVKSEVLKQLPAKEERVEFCAMSQRQQELYYALFDKLKRSSGEKRDLSNVMMALRKMANHPLLHRQYYNTERLAAMSRLMLKEPTHRDADPALIQEDMEVMSDFELHRLCLQYPALQRYQLQSEQLLDSGKFSLLTQLLASLKEKGDRVVLFSQFTMMLDIVEVLLKHLSHRYVRLDGSTPMADRIVLIDEFNTDPDIFVFLLSTRAGGLGINLTSANVVILHDIDCNPYNDKQAEDRCHRVGQTRTVQVIKLISKDSIEDCMLRVGQKKLKLEQDMTAAEEGDEGSMPEDVASLLKASLGL